MKAYKGTLYYILVDLAIPFQQLYPLIKNREWCRYKSEKEIDLDNDFIILSQADNEEEVRKIHKNSNINIKEVRYVPFNEWVVHTNSFVENTGEVDLILGTSYRGGRRKKKYIDYFFNRESLKIEFYGLIKEADFGKSIKNLKKPIFTAKLEDVTKIIEKNSTGFATIIIGDKNYNNNMITLRFAESLLANCVTFIDEEFDIKHKIYPNFDFFYVNSGDELEQKINFLKENKKYYEKILEIQHQKVEEMRLNNLPHIFSEALRDKKGECKMEEKELNKITNEGLKANENIELLDNKEETEEITEDLIESYIDEFSTYKVLREHIYKNEKGEPAFKVTKNDTSNIDNRFTTYHWEGGKWEIGLGDKKRILYNLPKLLEAVENDKPVFITFGEKDADTIMELLENRAVATTTLTRSTKKWKYEFNDYLKSNSLIIVLEDTTEKGKEFAEHTCKKLKYTRRKLIKLSIEKIKIYLKILETDVTDISEIKEKIQDDEKLRKILNKLLDKLNS